MKSAPFGTMNPAPEAVGDLDTQAMPATRHNRRAEDTGAGCRANAAADLARAKAPGGDYMRQRLEHSAAVWSERATLLERLEKSFKRRVLAA
jgi:hypothetical protein